MRSPDQGCRAQDGQRVSAPIPDMILYKHSARGPCYYRLTSTANMPFYPNPSEILRSSGCLLCLVFHISSLRGIHCSKMEHRRLTAGG